LQHNNTQLPLWQERKNMNEFTRIYATTENNETGESEENKTADTETVSESESDEESVVDDGPADDGSDAGESLADEIVDPADISSGDSGSDTGTVSDSDISDVSGSDQKSALEVSTGDVSSEVRYQTTAPVDYTDALEHINGSLTLIIWLLLFFWCYQRIKNAVRAFTGRNLKNE